VNLTELHIKRMPSESSYQGGRQLTVFLCEHLQLAAQFQLILDKAIAQSWAACSR
jgi:hypothetical protein